LYLKQKNVAGANRPCVAVNTDSGPQLTEPHLSEGVIYARGLKNQEEVMPTWRADYFDKSGDPAPARSVILDAESESDALDEVRAKMGSACTRAELIRIDYNSSTTPH
jgi:hypothetical protein